LAALVVLLVAGLRYQTIDLPLERDEGEYAYAGQRMLAGELPYLSVYNMKLPGTYAAFALLLTVFDASARGVHLALLLVNAATLLLVFMLGRRFGGTAGGIAGMAGFGLLSIAPDLLGATANAEHFVLLFAVGGLLLLLHAIDGESRSALIASGLLLGTAIVMKQHGAAFALLAVLHLWLCERSWKRPAILGGSVAAPLVLTGLLLWIGGAFERFWFWTVTYATQYSSQVTFAQGMGNLRRLGGEVLGTAPLLWLLAAVGLSAVVWERRLHPQRRFVLLLALFSFLAIVPGFHFRRHYFLLLLPLVAVGSALAMELLTRKFARKGIPIAILVAALLVSVFQHRAFFAMTPNEMARELHAHNPFPESIPIADFIRDNTSPEDRIAILGSEPQILAYAERASATGYIYTYPLMEEHELAGQMQREMIAEIEQAAPELIVFVRVGSSWLQRSGSKGLLLEWFGRYSAGYEVVGLVDIWEERTDYHWGPEVPWPSKSASWIAVLKRK
jgi:4-amino-4-deoxy-L-arabinose transferase-like glycosyltransferase